MTKSIVRQAEEEYKKGNYSKAVQYYWQAAALLGERNFRVNIWLCEQKLKFSPRVKEFSNKALHQFKIACVMDEFTSSCYDPECNLLPLTPDNARNELENFQPDLLFIESAWRGKDELWNRKISTLSHELKDVLYWCRQHQVPTVFWNKEDPVHFETFLNTAQQFDHVFTTDIDCIGRYKAALGHNRVDLLPFACQPKKHNPIELYPRKDAFCFAGAYYVRYPERIRDLENHVDELPNFRPLEIFDRNYGQSDVNYQFPPKYHPYIVGTLPFEEIDKAYKGYYYSINLNSIKQSQTMFARRVYELLGSNTITISNFSRGIRLMFGDLVITSDSGREILDRLRDMDDMMKRKLRLAGLRKVMLEHTYGQRLSYIVHRVFRRPLDNPLPKLVIFSLVCSKEDYELVSSSYLKQSHKNKRLVIVLGSETSMREVSNPGCETIDFIRDDKATLAEFLNPGDWLTLMVPTDYYGMNYLTDLAIATQFSDAKVIGKSDHYCWKDGVIQNQNPGTGYRPTTRLQTRSSAIHASLLPLEEKIMPWLKSHVSGKWEHPGFAIDPFNYCLDGHRSGNMTLVQHHADDLKLDIGIPLTELIGVSENIPPAKLKESNLPQWNVSKLMQMIGISKNRDIHFELVPGGLRIESRLPDGKHKYIYSRSDIPIGELPHRNELLSCLNATPGLNIQYLFVFLDETKKKIDHVTHTVNRNHKAAAPPRTAFLRFGLRIYGNGVATTGDLIWGHQRLEPGDILARAQVLLVTNQYPSYNNLYRYGFVHSRIKAYRERGVRVDVFRLRKDEPVSYHEFQNIDVITGSQNDLHSILSKDRYKNMIVHFLDPDIWEVLKHYQNFKIFIWIHGAEIQPWYRRDFNYLTDQERITAKAQSEVRMAFWRNLLTEMPQNLKLVFVSRYLAEEVMEDLGFRLPDEAYSIIHNPIDTDLFTYNPKPIEQRKRILSIASYASRKYANDLSVQTILKLSEKSFFGEMEFRMIGDGKLFEETIDPLRKFPNVIIERRFLTNSEIAAVHRDYGIFLCPTRWDSHGVSRDEAMSSGLVPVTNAIAAIPEFVDKECGILAEAEDSDAMAEGICSLHSNPKSFEILSGNAAKRVRKQTGKSSVIESELSMFAGAIHSTE